MSQPLCRACPTFHSTGGGYYIRIRGNSFGFKSVSRRIMFATFANPDLVMPVDDGSGTTRYAACHPPPPARMHDVFICRARAIVQRDAGESMFCVRSASEACLRMNETTL